MITRLRRTGQLWRYFGPEWLAYRAGYAFRQRSGLLRRSTPAQSWASQPLASFLHDGRLADFGVYGAYRRQESPIFFFGANDRMRYGPKLLEYDVDEVRPQALADRLLDGQWRFFEHSFLDIGAPPDWHGNALTGARAPSDRHWSQIPDFGYGDIKVIWEPSRFGFTYALVRTYWRGGEERYPEIFWRLVEDWRQHNPPNQGPNWKCGQEASFRVMAWVFGLYGFLNAKATTPQRIAMLAQMIAVSGHRIEANLPYAISQRNNHGISEGMGLWTIGLLFPELRRANAWRKRGREVLEKLGRDLIYEDGSFVQHSVNYHRLMLHDYLWALRLGQLHDQPFSPELQERVARAGQFLYQLQDAESGQVPYYGQNDGALILPLNNCDYLDFRPVVQATHYLTSGKRQFMSGLWDEDLLWLFGSEALSVDVDLAQRTDLRAKSGGYYTLRSQDGFAFVRCATYRDRPGQADMLHFDLWWRGLNIAADAGTYSYNASPPWDNPLAHTAYHNTVTVDGLDQMDRVGKFLWLPWLHSEVIQDCRSPQGLLTYWEGTHDGYRRLQDPVTHHRGILRIADDIWLVLDKLDGIEEHDYRLHWFFPDWPYDWCPDRGRIRLQSPVGAYHVQVQTPSSEVQTSIVTASEETPEGWRSPYYYYREGAISLAIDVCAQTVLFATLFSPRQGWMAIDGDLLQLGVDIRQVRIKLASDDNAMISVAMLSGAESERLDID